jgi:hypothetical protein
MFSSLLLIWWVRGAAPKSCTATQGAQFIGGSDAAALEILPEETELAVAISRNGYELADASRVGRERRQAKHYAVVIGA